MADQTTPTTAKLLQMGHLLVKQRLRPIVDFSKCNILGRGEKAKIIGNASALSLAVQESHRQMAASQPITNGKYPSRKR